MSNGYTLALTKEQCIIITGFTGVCCGDFGWFTEDIEKRLKRPVYTHEIPGLASTIKEMYRDDFMKLQPDATDQNRF